MRRIRFEPNPEKYVRPVRFEIGGEKIVVYESFSSYVYCSTRNSGDLILIAMAPDHYLIPEQSQRLEEFLARDEIRALGFTFEPAEPILKTWETGAELLMEPIYRIPEESFVGLILRNA